MKRLLSLLLALATLLAPLAGFAAGGTTESMSERELKRILQRQHTILAAAQEAGDNLDRSNTEMQLSEIVRDYEALDQDEKTINVHVSHLREKIEDDPASPAFVLTVRGVGYAFAER